MKGMPINNYEQKWWAESISEASQDIAYWEDNEPTKQNLASLDLGTTYASNKPEESIKYEQSLCY